MFTKTSLALVTLLLALAPAAQAQVSYDATVTGPEGGTASASGSGGYDAATGRSRSTTFTNGAGNSATRSVNGDCVASGAGTVECSRNSAVNDTSRTVNRTLGDGAAGRSVSRSGANGGSATRWITITR